MKKRRKKQSTKSYTCRISGLIMAITVIAVSGGVLLKRACEKTRVFSCVLLLMIIIIVILHKKGHNSPSPIRMLL